MSDAATTAAKMVTARECGCILQKWEKKAKKRRNREALAQEDKQWGQEWVELWHVVDAKGKTAA